MPSGTDNGSPSSVMIRLEEMQDAACAAGDHATIATIVSIIASFKFILVLPVPVFRLARESIGVYVARS